MPLGGDRSMGNYLFTGTPILYPNFEHSIISDLSIISIINTNNAIYFITT